MAGISAALLAQVNFTGAPALTVESNEVREVWQDLGCNWQITRQYFKPHAVCRWAQPAIEATLALQQKHQIVPENIKRIVVSTFHEAVRLDCRSPQSTEEAQYSLPFPLAAAFVHGRLGVAELAGTALQDPAVLRLSDLVEMVEDDKSNRQFPAKRIARVEIQTKDDQRFDSGEVEPKWEASSPPADLELREKFRQLSTERLAGERAAELGNILWRCEELPDLCQLLPLVMAPINNL
jgi:2-methylcitrate dehydratase PrpD